MATYNRNELLVRALQEPACMHTGGLDWEVILLNNAGNKAGCRGAVSNYTKCAVNHTSVTRVAVTILETG